MKPLNTDKLINKTPVSQVVKIVLADGTPDSINLQPRSRALPPEGATIDPTEYSSYVGKILNIELYKPVSATETTDE